MYVFFHERIPTLVKCDSFLYSLCLIIIFLKGQSLPFKEVSGGYCTASGLKQFQTTPKFDAVLILTLCSWPFSLRKTALAPFTKAGEIHYPGTPWKNQRLSLKTFL